MSLIRLCACSGGRLIGVKGTGDPRRFRSRNSRPRPPEACLCRQRHRSPKQPRQPHVSLSRISLYRLAPHRGQIQTGNGNALCQPISTVCPSTWIVRGATLVWPVSTFGSLVKFPTPEPRSPASACGGGEPRPRFHRGPAFIALLWRRSAFPLENLSAPPLDWGRRDITRHG